MPDSSRSMWRKSPAVVVWDPNPFNPYGLEVARVIHSTGRRVRYFGREGSTARWPGVSQLLLLPTASGGQRGPIIAIRFALGILAMVAYAIMTRPDIVVTWLTTRPEILAIRLMQLLGIRTHIIWHNPVKGRGEGEEGHAIAHLRSKASSVVVHSPRLVPPNADRGKYVVISHPSYLAWARATDEETNNPGAIPQRRRPVCLYLGGARQDKGFTELPEIAASLSRRGALLSIVIGRLNEAQRQVFDACHDALKFTDGRSYAPDWLVRHALNEADILIAPYRDVTASGTTVMALTLGIPVVGYRSPGLVELLPPDFLVAPGCQEELADACVRIHRGGMRNEELVELAEHLDDSCREGWASVLSLSFRASE